MIRRAAAVAAVGLVLAAAQSVPLASAAPDHKWMSFSGGIAPGSAIGQVTPNGRSYSHCTVGFIAQKDARQYIVTAGHCYRPSSTHSSTVMYTDASSPTVARTAGRFTSARDGDTTYAGSFPTTTDMAVIELAPTAQVATPLVGGKYRISEILRQPDLRLGMQMCKIGSASEETCAPISSIGTDYVTADVHAVKGDSGALGFVKKKDGTVAAVGILSTSGGKFYYLTPPLRSMGLSLVSNP